MDTFRVGRVVHTVHYVNGQDRNFPCLTVLTSEGMLTSKHAN